MPTAHLALADALDHPRLASVLFGATSRAQVRKNVAAVGTWEGLTGEQRAVVHALTERP